MEAYELALDELKEENWLGENFSVYINEGEKHNSVLLQGKREIPDESLKQPDGEWNRKGCIGKHQGARRDVYKRQVLTAVHTPRFCGADASVAFFCKELYPLCRAGAVDFLTLVCLPMTSNAGIQVMWKKNTSIISRKILQHPNLSTSVSP